MSDPKPISEVSQSLSPDAFVSLFVLDASAINGGILRWCSTVEADGSPVKWNNDEYPPLNFTTEGFTWDGETMPRPTITASVADKTGGSLSQSALDIIVGYKGGQGATVYRTRTLVRYLDGHEDGGHGIAYPSDVYLIDRLVELTKSYVKWELIAPMDLPNCKLPSRQALRDACPWVYRRYNAESGAFDYDNTDMACPYTGSGCYTKNGETTTAANDECGRRLSDCVLRFGQENPLPYGGFPGLARIRK